MVAAIDNAAFPHIVDGVWANFNVETVFVARQVCAEWREKAHRYLQRCVEVLCDSASQSCVLSTKVLDGDALSHRVWRFLYRLPRAPVCAEALRHVRVLDLRSPLFFPPFASQVREILGQLQPSTAVRTMVTENHQGGAVPTAGSTQVFFLRYRATPTLAAAQAHTIVLNFTEFPSYLDSPVARGELWRLLDGTRRHCRSLVCVFEPLEPLRRLLEPHILEPHIAHLPSPGRTGAWKWATHGNTQHRDPARWLGKLLP